MGVTAISDLLLKIKRTFVSKSFLEFCALGLINTFNDAVFSSLYHWLGLQNNFAAVLGYFTALTIAFFLSSKFLFKKRIRFSRYIKFFISYIPNFIIFFLVTFITINTMRLPQFWGTVLAAAAGGPVTYVVIKVYAFGKKKS
ncbi:MAG: GtrA family protein [Clostridia bacterium]|nr:GtrA family protein [Clostridia bacterium]